MAPRKRRKQTITLTRGPDGSWHEPGVISGAYVTDPDLAKTSPFLPRSPAEIRTLQQALGLKVPPEGVDIKPTLRNRLFVYEHPPVPGSIGKWTGKGTRDSPYHWVGISEKAFAIVAAILLAIWGIEVMAVDVSNWWSGSVLNVSNSLDDLDSTILAAMGIQLDSSGKPVARAHADFLTWLLQQVWVQSTDIGVAINSVNTISTGFSPGQGYTPQTNIPIGPPPGGQPGPATNYGPPPSSPPPPPSPPSAPPPTSTPPPPSSTPPAGSSGPSRATFTP